jgi:hypothetical protein
VFFGSGPPGREVPGAGHGEVPDTDVIMNYDRGLRPATAAADRRADLDHHNHARIITGQPNTDQPMQAANRARTENAPWPIPGKRAAALPWSAGNFKNRQHARPAVAIATRNGHLVDDRPGSARQDRDHHAPGLVLRAEDLPRRRAQRRSAAQADRPPGGKRGRRQARDHRAGEPPAKPSATRSPGPRAGEQAILCRRRLHGPSVASRLRASVVQIMSDPATQSAPTLLGWPWVAARCACLAHHQCCRFSVPRNSA